MKHRYEIIMSNKDKIYYYSELNFEEFKKLLLTQEWLDINKDTYMSYNVFNIVYVNWDEQQEKEQIERHKKGLEQDIIKDKILSYNHNLKFKLWISKKYFLYGGYKYFINLMKEKYNGGLFRDEWLNEILNKLKQYKCELK